MGDRDHLPDLLPLSYRVRPSVVNPRAPSPFGRERPCPEPLPSRQRSRAPIPSLAVRERRDLGRGRNLSNVVATATATPSLDDSTVETAATSLDDGLGSSKVTPSPPAGLAPPRLRSPPASLAPCTSPFFALPFARHRPRRRTPQSSSPRDQDPSDRVNLVVRVSTARGTHRCTRRDHELPLHRRVGQPFCLPCRPHLVRG